MHITLLFTFLFCLPVVLSLVVVGIIVVALVVVCLWRCKSKHRNELQPFKAVHIVRVLIAKVSVVCVWDNPLKVVSFFYIVLYLQESKSAKVLRLPTSVQGLQSTSDVFPLPTREEPLLTSPFMTGDEQLPSSPSAVEYRPIQISLPTVGVVPVQASISLTSVVGLMENRSL